MSNVESGKENQNPNWRTRIEEEMLEKLTVRNVVPSVSRWDNSLSVVADKSKQDMLIQKTDSWFVCAREGL